MLHVNNKLVLSSKPIRHNQSVEDKQNTEVTRKKIRILC